MATADQVTEVRLNTNEPDSTFYTDEAIGLLIDATSVNLASAKIWEQKAARYADETDVTEAGASRAGSKLYDHAAKEAARYNAADDIGKEPDKLRAKVHVIARSE